MIKIKSKSIAILGATGYIGKSLVERFLAAGNGELHLFTRAPECMKSFLGQWKASGSVHVSDYSGLTAGSYDAIINCVGVGDPAKVAKAGGQIFRLTEEYDNLVLDYLEHHPETLYLFMSSGAAYGGDFSVPVGESTYARMDINHLAPADYYGLAKINAEAKHRSLVGLNIVDLRIFGFFSRFIDTKAKFFLSEVVSCIQEGRQLVTGDQDMVRDYVHPGDLFSLLEKCIAVKAINDVFDVYSLKPATKFEILAACAARFGLRYEVVHDAKVTAVTGAKMHYYSTSRKAAALGYAPEFTSISCVSGEMAALQGREPALDLG